MEFSEIKKVVSKFPYLFYLILNQNEIQNYMKSISSASSAQGNISNSQIESVDYIIPANEYLEKFHTCISPLFNKITYNLSENISLSKFRDSLLPKLMNGKIRVK